MHINFYISHNAINPFSHFSFFGVVASPFFSVHFTNKQIEMYVEWNFIIDFYISTITTATTSFWKVYRKLNGLTKESAIKMVRRWWIFLLIFYVYFFFASFWFSWEKRDIFCCSCCCFWSYYSLLLRKRRIQNGLFYFLCKILFRNMFLLHPVMANVIFWNFFFISIFIFFFVGNCFFFLDSLQKDEWRSAWK